MMTYAVALPLVAAFLLPILHGAARWLGAVAGPAALVAVLLVVYQSWQPAALPFAIDLGGFAPPWGITFYVDSLALLFCAAVALMTLLLWPRDEGEGDTDALVRRRVLTLLLAAAAAGLALSGDLFNIYVFYELAAVASYGLAAERGTPAAYAAAFRYLMLSALGSVIALFGIAIVYFQTGTLNLAHLALVAEELQGPAGIAAFLCLLVGFGVKAELFPVNAWVPEVYGVTTRRTAGLLAGVVSKLAVLVLVRLLVLVFPQEELRDVLLVLGVLGMVGGELAAWKARDMARMLAFSSIGQLGLVFVAFSLPGDAGLVAGIIVAVHHLVLKPGLFMLAGQWGGGLQGLVGAARRAPLAGLLFVLFALSLVGLPPLPGFWAKFLVLTGLAGEAGGLAWLAIVAIIVATVLEVSYLFRLAGRLYSRGDEGAPAGAAGGGYPVTAGLLGALLVAAVVFAVPLWEVVQDMAAEAGDVALYVRTVGPMTGGGAP
ncbi:MAG: proton-conducting transporter membrane subunit [Gammaproteobacteria bacterium]|nr:proton-conducting transporter membrane subunit [Gammaproteobacteria bacterium]